jgi:hypothetical protein
MTEYYDKNKNFSTEDPYADILHMPHHQSTKHPHMPISDRAAQFAPFAALTGHRNNPYKSPDFDAPSAKDSFPDDSVL